MTTWNLRSRQSEMSFDIVLGVVLLVVIVALVVGASRGRPKQPPHKPGSLVRGYHRTARSQRSNIDRRIRRRR
jgi:hypothetical protein